jgi:uncharacterized membrane protein YedE/YeeE
MAAAVFLAKLINAVLVPQMLRPSLYSLAVYSYISALQFGLGLIVSGMANPTKVLRFFSWGDLSHFDPSLALVMLFGVGPNLWSYLSMKREYGNEEGKKTPTLASRFRLPSATVADIDWRFIAGAIAFGVGWGLNGVCPGPGVLRTVMQPAWGVAWMGGFALASLLGI